MALVENSALHTARARFVESLPGRALELSSTAEHLARDPRDVEALEALRRRLHTLLASAQVFEERALGMAVTDLLARLDRAALSAVDLPADEIDAIVVVVQSLPTYLRPSAPPAPLHSDVHELHAASDPVAELHALPARGQAPDGVAQAAPERAVELLGSAADGGEPRTAPLAPGSGSELLAGSSGAAPIVEAGGAIGRAIPARDGRVASGVMPVLHVNREPAPADSISAAIVPAEAEHSRHGSDVDRLAIVPQTVSGLVPAPRLSALLFVDCYDSIARLRTDLPETRFELAHASSADEAVRMLHELEPDLVFVSAELASQPEIDLVRRLRTDPLVAVSAVYVLLPEGATHDAAFLRQTSADAVVREPLDETQLSLLLARHSAQRSPARPLSALREGTVDEIANQVAEEIRRGIAGSLKVGRHERVRIGDGTELMAAAWSAIGRVRSHLAEQNRGRLRFREQESGEVSLLPSSAGTSAAPAAAPGQLLSGCRVLVVDDDPAVLWFFVGLLREASAQVFSAHNGREALELARRKQPHVVISDILMPKLDGFGLCRELKRDALLAQVPVILLSWKDDLLERMRELESGAAGYLRKEAGSKQILASLSDVLRPRAQVVAGLRSLAPVVGAIERGLGVPSLLELVAVERPEARIVVRDAWSIFEVDLRGGRRLSVTRTAADGGFTRGDKALMQLLGLSSGRFEVSAGSGALRTPLAEPLDRALVVAGRKLSALLDAVSDTRLLQVSLIAFDDEVLASLLSAPSTRLSEVVALFRTGNASAEAVLREGGFAPGELEGYLRELARRLAITGVWNAQGEDMVASALREREPPTLALLTSALLPPALVPAAVRGDRETPMVPLDPVMVERAALQRASEWPASSTDGRPTEQVLDPVRAQRRAERHAARDSGELAPLPAADSLAPGPLLDLGERPTYALLGELPTLPPPACAEALEIARVQSATPGESVPSAGTAVAGGQDAVAVATAAGGAERESRTPAPEIAERVTLPQPFARAAESSQAVDAVSAAEREELGQPLPKAPRQRGEGLGLLALLSGLFIVGYLGWRELAPATGTIDDAHAPPAPVAPVTHVAPVAPVTPVARGAPGVQAPPAAPPAPATELQQTTEPVLGAAQLGRVLPFIDPNRGVRVGPDQGLLVVEYTGEGPAPSLRVGERELGKPPLAVALPAGRHEIVLRNGTVSSFRFLIVRAGETRIVQLPLAGL